MQLIFWAHSNSATKHLKRNFLQQIEEVLYSFWLGGHSSTPESEERKQQGRIFCLKWIYCYLCIQQTSV